MTKIGNREVIGTYSLLIPKDESASVNLEALGRKLALRLQFVNGPGTRGVQIFPTSEAAADITFTNWNESIGVGLKEPFALMKVDGDTIFFMAANYQIGDMNHLHIQFLLVRNSK